MKRGLLLFILFISCCTLPAFAQHGIISGKVVDKNTGEEIVGANVYIDGTQTGAAADVNGNFQFTIDPGTYTLVASFIGYAPFKVTDLQVNASEDVNLTIQMQTDDVQLEEVVVIAKADKTSEALLLLERKEAVDIRQSIGAQEFSRKGLNTVESAVTQVTGVSKQEGVKNVFVRGLGDRYNSTSMNGLPLPSEDPAYKNIALDFFSTDVINSIDINKTFGSGLYGDVAGANINIESRELFDEDEYSISISGGVNSQVPGKEFLNPDGENFFGGTDDAYPISDLNQYNFPNSYQPNVLSRPLINSSISFSGGKTFDIGSNNLTAYLVAGLSNNYEYKKGVERQLYYNGNPRQSYDYEKFEYNTSHMALGNLNYTFGSNNNISYNGLYIFDSRQFVGNYTGYNVNANDSQDDPNAFKSFKRRQQVNDNSLFVNQLVSRFNFDEVIVDVSGSYNMINGEEPDRRTNDYKFNGESYQPNTVSSSANNRFFSNLTEDDIAGKAAITYLLGGDSDSNNKLKVGYNFRNTQRDFTNVQYEHNFAAAQNTFVEINDPDALFNQQSLDNDVFEFRTQRGTGANALTPFYYHADRTIHAVLINFTYDLGDHLTVDIGGRYEKINQSVDWDTNIDEKKPFPGDNTVELNPDYFLPALNLRYSLTDDNILRLAASKSYTFPQFKEVAPFFYEDVTRAEFGNPYLLPSDNYNVDLKYEHYFTRSELIAFTIFYKRIDNAINRALVTSASNETSFINTGDADAYGAEIELRKDLWSVSYGDATSRFTVGLNASYLFAKQQLKDVPTDNLTFDPTHDESRLEGASPLLVNSDLTYSREGGKSTFTSALVLNYFYDRIYSIGAPNPIEDIIEKGIPTLDWISKYGFNENFSMSLNFRNILNPEYQLEQEIETGEVKTISSYKKGINLSVGLTYKF